MHNGYSTYNRQAIPEHRVVMVMWRSVLHHESSGSLFPWQVSCTQEVSAWNDYHTSSNKANNVTQSSRFSLSSIGYTLLENRIWHFVKMKWEMFFLRDYAPHILPAAKLFKICVLFMPMWVCKNTHTQTHNVTVIKSTTTGHALYYENGTCMWYSWQNVFLHYQHHHHETNLLYEKEKYWKTSCPYSRYLLDKVTI